MRALMQLFRGLALGLLLIALAAAVLLYSDLGSRDRQRRVASLAAPLLRIAVVQHASIQAIDDGVRGLIDALANRGYAEGPRLELRRYNAAGDMATANTIAKDVVSEGFDLIASISTASLQTIANANAVASPPKRHVFGVSTDPYGAGVGVSRENHLDHPPYMTGIGSMAPIEDAFRLLATLRPDVARIGLVWNTNEANSVAATELAREIAADMGLELVEANAENSNFVGEAAAAVVSRGIDAMWISPDTTTVTAADLLIDAAQAAGVPTFTSVPGHADKGALFDIGADYYAIGETQGQLAADVLDGTDPATIPVENVMPVELHVNLLALEGLEAQWQVPASVRERADVLIDADGRHVRQFSDLSAPAQDSANVSLSRFMSVHLIEYADTPNTDISRQGVLDGLTQAGLEPDRDIEFRRHSAQGDMPTLSSIVDSVVSGPTDLIVTLSTPALQAALQRGREIPIVFSMVSDPFIIGAGDSDADHLPNVTGAYLAQPIQELLDSIRLVFPEARRLGTLYTPAEINSEYNMHSLETAALEAGYEFEKIGIATVTDIADAAIALGSLNLDVWTQVSDNLISSSFPAVMEASRRADLPVITFSPAAADFGAMIIVARDYYDTGVESGLIAARVLRGESTASIPFTTSPRLSYIVNLAKANEYGIEIPQELMDTANRVIR
ncbi:MAG TPA: ABC transporter substrate-binding protein [Gammaproteobacteria bacterium]|nr:ABC transporter substrate-binding protein [Gammaproteobacteria bacterium]